jgi:DNA-binding MarR family transcriptional regulator
MPNARKHAVRRSSRGKKGRQGKSSHHRVVAAGRDGLAAPMAILQQFRELFRLSQRHFQRIESRCGISGAQLWALSEVERFPAPTVSELARALSIHLSTSSNLLDKLEAQSLVRRERRSADQRIVRVHVTPAGRRVLAKAPKPLEGIIPGALSRMSPAALRRLQRDLDVLLELAGARSARDALKPLAEP